MSWKQWDQGEVVEAGDFQEFIQDQVVQSYANASERSTTLGTAVKEGMLSYREDVNVVEVYDGSSWVGVGEEGDITAVTAGTALTGGGTSGAVTLDVDLSAVTIPTSQISDITATAAELNTLDGITATTAELNHTDGVTSNIQTQLDSKQGDVITTEGDLVVGGTGGTAERLGIGTADQVLTSDGTAVTWADASGGGAAIGSNLLFNGAMQVTQRGTSETGITGIGFFTADRWQMLFGTAGTWTQTIEADAPTGQGFANSLKIECTTANASLSAGSFGFFRQQLEGQDVQEIKKGTVNAESLTISFWVKSNVTGTYVVEIRDADNLRQINKSYTVSSSGVWEKKTITFDPDTTGTLDNDNSNSLVIAHWLVAGSDLTSGTLSTTWQAYSNTDRAVGQVNLAASTSNYWQMTGVKLETGTTATDFDFQKFGEELAACSRYFERINMGRINTATSGNSTVMSLPYMTRKRSTPSVSTTATNANYGSVWSFSQSGVSLSSKSGTVTINFDGTSGGLNHLQINAVGATYSPIPNTLEGLSGLYFDIDAEL